MEFDRSAQFFLSECSGATVENDDFAFVGRVGANQVAASCSDFLSVPRATDASGGISGSGQMPAPPVPGTKQAPDRAESGQRPYEPAPTQERIRFPSPNVMTDQDATSAVDSHHLRAARALLGWAMSDLARVSGLSLSTIRRLEQNAHGVSVRNHRSAVEALRTGGIRFLRLDDGTIALGELGHLGALAGMTADGD